MQDYMIYRFLDTMSIYSYCQVLIYLLDWIGKVTLIYECFALPSGHVWLAHDMDFSRFKNIEVQQLDAKQCKCKAMQNWCQQMPAVDLPDVRRMVHADDWSSFERGPHLQGQTGSGACSSQRADVCPSRNMSVSSMLSICTAYHWSSLNIPRRSLRSLRIIGQEGQITKIALITLEKFDAGFARLIWASA